MSKIDDGGTAFPYGQKNFTERYSEGLSMRDYFAAAALTGNLASNAIGYEYTGENAIEKAVNEAYRYADAMIAARKEGA